MARATKTIEAKKGRAIRWRMWAWIGVAGAVCVSTGMAALKVREFALGDPQFLLSRDKAESLTITGLRYASKAKVHRVFAGDFGRSIFSAPLEERRRRL